MFFLFQGEKIKIIRHEIYIKKIVDNLPRRDFSIDSFINRKLCSEFNRHFKKLKLYKMFCVAVLLIRLFALICYEK